MTKRRDVFVHILKDETGTILPKSRALFGAARTITERTGGTVYAVNGNDPDAMAALEAEYRPCAMLFPAGIEEQARAAQLAAKTDAMIVTDVEAVRALAKNKQLVWKKTAFGGYVASEVVAEGDRLQIGLIRNGAYPVTGEDTENIEERNAVEENTSQGKRLRLIKSHQKPEVNLEDADIIVAGGRGAGGPEGFLLIRQLAEALGGQVAASRVAVDYGWAPKNCLVGQSGIKVRPKLYINCGISGSVQHITGMRDAGCIVSINSDPKALIFNVSDYCIVGDMFQILPSLIARVNERRTIHA